MFDPHIRSPKGLGPGFRRDERLEILRFPIQREAAGARTAALGDRLVDQHRPALETLREQSEIDQPEPRSLILVALVQLV